MSTHKAFPNDSYTRSGDYVGNYNGGRSEISEITSNLKRRNVRVMGGNSTYVGKRVLLVHHMDLEKAHKALREFYPKHYATDLMSNLKRDVETDKKMGVFENETNNMSDLKNLKTFESFDTDDEKEPELNTMAKVIKELGSRGHVKMPVVQFIYDNIERLTGKDISHFQSINDFSDESEPGIHVITNMIGYYQMDGDDFANDWDLTVKSKGKLKWKTNENAVNEAGELRIRLDDGDFKTLVSGGEVSGNGYKIILADIGWDNMIRIIQEAKQKG